MGTRTGMALPGCLQQHPEEFGRAGEVRALILGLSGAAWECPASARGVQGQLREALPGPMGEGRGYGWGFFPNLNYSL